MTYLLDTNAWIAVVRGHPGVRARLGAEAPDDCGVSTITIYELFSGVERCRDPDSERKKIATLLAPLHILPFDHAAALEAARIRWGLERRGNLIGPYDILLAAQALTLDVLLVTRNIGEFSRVDGLRWENWQTDD